VKDDEEAGLTRRNAIIAGAVVVPTIVIAGVTAPAWAEPILRKAVAAPAAVASTRSIDFHFGAALLVGSDETVLAVDGLLSFTRGHYPAPPSITFTMTLFPGGHIEIDVSPKLDDGFSDPVEYPIAVYKTLPDGSNPADYTSIRVSENFYGVAPITEQVVRYG
jgi:hypothetical protein